MAAPGLVEVSDDRRLSGHPICAVTQRVDQSNDLVILEAELDRICDSLVEREASVDVATDQQAPESVIAACPWFRLRSIFEQADNLVRRKPNQIRRGDEGIDLELSFAVRPEKAGSA